MRSWLYGPLMGGRACCALRTAPRRPSPKLKNGSQAILNSDYRVLTTEGLSL